MFSLQRNRKTECFEYGLLSSSSSFSSISISNSAFCTFFHFAFTHLSPLIPFFPFYQASFEPFYHSLHMEHWPLVNFILNLISTFLSTHPPLVHFPPSTSLSLTHYLTNNNPGWRRWNRRRRGTGWADTQPMHPPSESANAFLSRIKARLVSLMYLP